MRRNGGSLLAVALCFLVYRNYSPYYRNINPIYTREVTEMALILLVMVVTLRLGMDAIDIQEGRV